LPVEKQKIKIKNQKIAACGCSYAPVGAAAGCDLLIFGKAKRPTRGLFENTG